MLKKVFIFASLILLGFPLATAARSQDQIISQAAFEAGLQRHSRPPEEWRGKARRFRQITITPSGVLREVSEYDASGSSKRKWEGTSNGQPVKQESISVGPISYNKMGTAKWTWKEKETAGRPAHIAPFENDGRPLPFKVGYEQGAEFEFRLAPGEYKGADVLIYTRIKRSKPRTGEIRAEAVNVLIINKYWLALDGRLVRFEQWDNHRTAQSATTSHIWSEWELDPKIVIRAPIIEP